MANSVQGLIPQAEPVRFVELVFPDQANHYGTLFGGNALSLMGKAAFVAATRHARCAVVMASSDNVQFENPVKVGEIAELNSWVSRVGRSSMTVDVEVTAENLMTGQRRLAIRGSFEMIAVDDSGRPRNLHLSSPLDV
jgi:acyl-CoA hydrolase